MRIGRVLDASDSRHNPARTRTRGYRLESPEKSLLRQVNDDEGSLTSVDRVTLRAMGEVPWDERPGFDGVSYAERHGVTFDHDDFRAAQEEFTYDETQRDHLSHGRDVVGPPGTPQVVPDLATRRTEILNRMRRPSVGDSENPPMGNFKGITEKQSALIEKLLEELKGINAEVYGIAHDWYRDERAAGKMNLDRASDVIARLKKHCGYEEKGWAKRADFVRSVSAPSAIDHSTPIDYFEDIPDAYYALRDPDGHVKFFRVSTWSRPWADESRPGRKVQSQASDTLYPPLKRAASRTVLREIRETGVRDSALLYGREIGRCCRCGRTLTDDDSRAAGIGPTCASKGW